MEPIIKAIETSYSGCKFRSRLEARWAVFFDALEIRWEYEKEGYDLGNGILYLPDFWMPDQNCFIEIKGEHPTKKEIQKVALLAVKSKKDVLIFWGQVGEYPNDCALIYGGSDGQMCGEDNCYSWHKPEEEHGWGRHSRPDPKPKWDVVYAESNYIDYSGEEEIRKAENIARSARFEFGANGR